MATCTCAPSQLMGTYDLHGEIHCRRCDKELQATEQPESALGSVDVPGVGVSTLRDPPGLQIVLPLVLFGSTFVFFGISGYFYLVGLLIIEIGLILWGVKAERRSKIANREWKSAQDEDAAEYRRRLA